MKELKPVGMSYITKDGEPIASIDWAKPDGDYTMIFHKDGTFELMGSCKELDEEVD